MKIREQNKEVLYVEDPIVEIEKSDLNVLLKRINMSEKGRVRLCLHATTEDSLHEMFILMSKGTYVRPHRHKNKVESFHIIEGEVDVVIFDEDGTPKESIKMGDYRSGKKFFYRLSQSLFHTVVVRTDRVLFHETTNGPFDKADTEYARWAPGEEPTAGYAYLEELEKRLWA